MPDSGLIEFISELERNGELQRIHSFVDPVMEIAEITDRVTKAKGKALLFENTGTDFPVLINAFGSEKRMAMAIGRTNLNDAGEEISKIFESLPESANGFINKISALPGLIRLSGLLPSRSKRKGRCQQVIHNDPDLGILPVLKCWPHDAGRFVTLPMVHTIHPVTRKTNVGMYRMQVLGNNSTGMHWQLHKTGANHFEAWKKTGERMPVSVALGGDPVYTYAATAPLPENIDEYLLAGFLRKKKVRLVKCITNDLYVPEDADIVIEGFVDPKEELVWEGPFGDHTGFYSLADWYPRFHVTCITHARNAVYPATIVGIPPQEDALLAMATEKIFLNPIKLTLQPEVTDLHMPDAGVAHNLVIVKINKSYSGQGMKVISSLLGAGQMMFTKYMIVVDGNINIRHYGEVFRHVIENTDFSRDLNYFKGPLDVLDHASDGFAFGGKLGIDSTIKTNEEKKNRIAASERSDQNEYSLPDKLKEKDLITGYYSSFGDSGVSFLVLSADNYTDNIVVEKIKKELLQFGSLSSIKLVFVVDRGVDANDLYSVAWQVLGNTDPVRDHFLLPGGTLFIDATFKAFTTGGFMRKWPNIVCSDQKTIETINRKWNDLGINGLLESPSIRKMKMLYPGNEEITI